MQFFFSSLLFFIANKLKETWNFPNRDADDDATFFSEPRKFRSRNNRREEKKKLIQFQFNHLPSTRIRICARWALELNSMSFVIYYTFVIRDLSILSFFPPNQSDTEFSHPSFAFCGRKLFSFLFFCFTFHCPYTSRAAAAAHRSTNPSKKVEIAILRVKSLTHIFLN